MKEGLIGVIVPVYNTEKYIRKCLDSIIAQTYTNWEAILVNDGSTDNSGKICDEYAAKDNRFKVIHQENGGVSVARQTGLDNATGDYIIHCDPLLAHPERYMYMSKEEYIELHEEGVKFQLNIPSLAGCYGTAVKKKAEWLLKEGLYSVAGSDLIVKMP